MEKILKLKKPKSLIRLTVNSVKLCKHLTSHIRVFNDNDILQGFCFQKELKINTVEISSSCFCMYTISLKKKYAIYLERSNSKKILQCLV